MEKEKMLFDEVMRLGEGIFKRNHIIDTSEDDERSFRVYNSGGYCFDITQRQTDDEEYTGIKYEYILFSNFDGFREVDADGALYLLSRR